MKITIPADTIRQILAMPDKDGFSRDTRLAFAALVFMKLPAEEYVPAAIRGEFRITDLPDGSVEAEYSRPKGEAGESEGTTSCTCGRCGAPVLAEPPRGSTSAARLQATALYCRACDEIVCIACGVQKMSAGEACPCGICGGPARTVDADNHPTWYPGPRPVKAPHASAPVSASPPLSMPSGPARCWFCKTALSEDAGLQVGLHGNVKWKFKRIPPQFRELAREHGEESALRTVREKFDQQLATQTLGDVFACTWDKVSVTLPRCAGCRTIHASVADLKNRIINVSLFTGAGIGAGIGIALWVFLSVENGMVVVAISAMVTMILSAILGNSIANARKRRWQRGSLSENDVADFPLIQEKLASGWRMGVGPEDVEAWNWGLK